MLITLRLKFKREAAAEILRRKIQRSVQRNCKDIQVVFIFTSNMLIPTPTKDRLAVMSAPNVVYQFTCNTCHLRYIGKTTRRLEERAKEQIPKWLNGATLGMIRSSITEHIIDSGHR